MLRSVAACRAVLGLCVYMIWLTANVVPPLEQTERGSGGGVQGLSQKVHVKG